MQGIYHFNPLPTTCFLMPTALSLFIGLCIYVPQQLFLNAIFIDLHCLIKTYIIDLVPSAKNDTLY